MEYRGHWFIPADSNPCAGTLTFDPENGAQLELIGQLQSATVFSPVPIIHGRTSEGFVTLIDTRRRKGRHSSVTNTSTSVYQPSFIFAGHCFAEREEIAFRSVKFSLFNMLEWLEPKGFAESQKEDGYILEFTRPEPIEFLCSEGCRGKIEFPMSHRHHNELLDIQVSQRADIYLRYAEKKNYTDILQDIFVFVRLVTLCTYEQSYPTAIEFSDDDLTDEFVEHHLKRTILRQIHCYYRNAFYRPSYMRRKWHQHLVPVSSIEGKLSSILTAWFAQAGPLAQPIELLLRFFVDQYDFSVERFMDIVKAVELFHRLNHPESAKSGEEFKEWVKRFFSPDLSDLEREWLESKINYGYEPTLKNRLKELVRIYAFPYFNERVTNRNRFYQHVVDCRNYYTHFGDGLKDKALNGKELFQLSENLKLLLLSAILRGAEVPIDAVDEAIRRVIY